MLFLQLSECAHQWSLAVRSPFRRGFQSELAIRREWAIKFDSFVCSFFFFSWTRSTCSIPRLLIAVSANSAVLASRHRYLQVYIFGLCFMLAFGLRRAYFSGARFLTSLQSAAVYMNLKLDNQPISADFRGFY